MKYMVHFYTWPENQDEADKLESQFVELNQSQWYNYLAQMKHWEKK